MKGIFMVPVSYDLHTHSCLSPCGDNEATPVNIAGMAALAGLDVIALTDHNTARNCPAFLEACDAYGVIGIPGMEVTTMEEVHVVCLFYTLEDALKFDEFIYSKLQKIKNNPEIFGEQRICNSDDEIIGYEENLLINATDIMFDELYDIVEKFRGVMIPAHIDKNANSVLANLGFIPDDSKFKCVELANLKNLHKLREAHPYLEKCRIITDSDAHYLPNINEPVNTLYVKERSREGVLDTLSGL